MQAPLIADKAVEEIEKGTKLIVLNFANADMVGHTGKLEPTITAVKFLDKQIKKVVEAIQKNDGVAIITADHGNAELMYDEKSKQPYTAHTLNKVPFIITKKDLQLRENGTLADITPTILSLFGLPIPAEMTGKNLVTSFHSKLVEPSTLSK
jgi:2,3-bisphosphoglycerate-independent phosphoglycerate mutase